MKRFACCALFLGIMIQAMAEELRQVEAYNRALGCGINLGNALDAPEEGAWGVTLEADYFRLIAEAGFDSVRLPVRWSAHALEEAPYTIDPAFFARVDWALEQAHKHELLVVLNIHHYEGIMKDPAAHRPRVLALWKQIAERYRGQPQSVAFELLNEPHDQLDAEAWNRLLLDLLEVVRASNPERIVVIGPVGWNNFRQLPKLKLPEDDQAILVTFHYYDPFRFTHQGAGWVGEQSQAWLGERWEGLPEEQQAVREQLDRAAAWGREQGRPLYLGEFGAYSKADMDSRIRWARFVREEAMARGMSVAWWEFCSGFGLYDPKEARWREALREAALGSRTE